MRHYLMATLVLVFLMDVGISPFADGGEIREEADIQLILIGTDGPSLIGIDVSVDHTPLTEAWEEAFAEIHYFYDRNGNGSLDQHEVTGRLLSDFVIRQWAWGQYTPTTGRTPDWHDLDRDRSGEVSVKELSAYYRSRGLGRGVIAVGYPAWTSQLTEALVHIVDTNSDGKTTRKEWTNVRNLLVQYDANGDELIGPGELVLQAVYPGATGSILLNPTSLERYNSEQFHPLPLLVPEPSSISQVWPKELLRRLDDDGDMTLSLEESGMTSQSFTDLDGNRDRKLSSQEIERLLDQALANHLIVDFSGNIRSVAIANQSEDASAVSLPYRIVKDGLQFSFSISPGFAQSLQTAAQKRLSAQFDSVDADKDGRATSTEVAATNLLEFARMKSIADRDGDGVLSREEFDAWIACHQAVAKAQVFITLLSYGPGLFELLDQDRGGGLSASELADAPSILKAAGAFDADGTLATNQLPLQLHAVISRGTPTQLLSGTKTNAPNWFTAMDRNQDGTLSRKEFLGDNDHFTRLDRDGSQTISIAEVEKSSP